LAFGGGGGGEGDDAQGAMMAEPERNGVGPLCRKKDKLRERNATAKKNHKRLLHVYEGSTMTQKNISMYKRTSQMARAGLRLMDECGISAK
jgi:DNA-binding SARP family transcriptional activator